MANGGGYTGTVWSATTCLDQNNASNAAACSGRARQLTAALTSTADGRQPGDTAALDTPSNTASTRRYGVPASPDLGVRRQQPVPLCPTPMTTAATARPAKRSTSAPTPCRAKSSAARKGWGEGIAPRVPVLTAHHRTRDRFSLAILNQVSVDYFGSFLDDALTVAIAARAPQFKRELNQYCYSQNGSTNALGTTQAVATTLANGNVQFAGDTNQYIAPYKQEFTYEEILPNLSVGYALNDSNKVYASYSEQIAVPRYGQPLHRRGARRYC